MKWIIFILLSFNLWAAEDLSQLSLKDMCQSPRAPLQVKTNWEPRGSASNGFCVEVLCSEAGKKVTGLRCMLSQGGSENTISIWRAFYDGDTTNGESTSFTKVDVALTKEVACHEECKTKKTSILGVSTGEVRRLERPECLKCMVKNHHEDIDPTIVHPVTGEKIFNNTKCYELCTPPKGDFEMSGLMKDPAACQSCPQEQFNYLKSSSGYCVEIDSSFKYRFVDPKACETKKLMATEFYFQPESVGLIGWITGAQADPKKGVCYEVDSATGGTYFKRTTLIENCTALQNATVNDTGREQNKDIASPRSVEPSGDSSAGALQH